MTDTSSSSGKYPTNASSVSLGALGAASRTALKEASESPSVSGSWGDLSFQTARESHVESARTPHQVGLSDPRDLVLAVNSRVGHLCLCFRRPSEECAGGLRAFARYENYVSLWPFACGWCLLPKSNLPPSSRATSGRVIRTPASFRTSAAFRSRIFTVRAYNRILSVRCALSLLSRQEKERVALELGSAFALLLVLADQCNVDLPLAVELKIELNAKKYPALLVRWVVDRERLYLTITYLYYMVVHYSCTHSSHQLNCDSTSVPVVLVLQ